MRDAEASTKKWRGIGIFFSRWLITPLSPWLNLTSGITTYTYPKFLLWDVSGKVVWVIVYVMVGKLFSDRIKALTEMLGNLVWVLFGLIATALFAWMLVKHFRELPQEEEEGLPTVN